MSLVVFGVPGSISSPNLSQYEDYEPTVWESYSYSPNDLSGVTHPTDSSSYSDHRLTPSSVVFDALGRSIESTVRNHTSDTNEWFVTETGYDLRGNVLSVTDPLERVAGEQVYDLANRSLPSESIDAGFQHHSDSGSSSSRPRKRHSAESSRSRNIHRGLESQDSRDTTVETKVTRTSGFWLLSDNFNLARGFLVSHPPSTDYITLHETVRIIAKVCTI